MRKRTRNHHVNVALLLLAGICNQAACAGGPATRPDGVGRTYAGAWMGTTSEGTAIAFDVSDGNIVTHITIGRDNRGCRDALTFPSLSLTIGESDLPGRVPMSSSPGFGFRVPLTEQVGCRLIAERLNHALNQITRCPCN